MRLLITVFSARDWASLQPDTLLARMASEAETSVSGKLNINLLQVKTKKPRSDLL